MIHLIEFVVKLMSLAMMGVIFGLIILWPVNDAPVSKVQWSLWSVVMLVVFDFLFLGLIQWGNYYG